MGDEIQDFEIIRRVIGGDTHSYALLVERYKDKSLTVATSVLRNREEAEDACQEAFIKAFRNLEKFNFRASFATWLYRIVMNTCYTALQKQRRHLHTRFEEESEGVRALGNVADSNAASRDRREVIRTILNNLKPNEAIVLKLHYLSGQSVREIATITGLSVSNVKVLLHRGRQNFRKRLVELFDDDARGML